MSSLFNILLSSQLKVVPPRVLTAICSGIPNMQPYILKILRIPAPRNTRFSPTAPTRFLGDSLEKPFRRALHSFSEELLQRMYPRSSECTRNLSSFDGGFEGSQPVLSECFRNALKKRKDVVSFSFAPKVVAVVFERKSANVFFRRPLCKSLDRRAFNRFRTLRWESSWLPLGFPIREGSRRRCATHRISNDPTCTSLTAPDAEEIPWDAALQLIYFERDSIQMTLDKYRDLFDQHTFARTVKSSSWDCDTNIKSVLELTRTKGMVLS